MLDFTSYLKRPKNEASEEASAQAPVPANVLQDIKNDLLQIKANIPREIDILIARLMSDLMPGPESGHYKKGWWDSIKNWWSNLWRGKYSPGNPYYSQNRFGELGLRAEAHEDYSLSLEEYRMLNELHLQLEASAAGAPMIRLTSIINRWSQDVKRTLDNYINNAIHKVDGMLKYQSSVGHGQPPKPEPEGPEPPAPKPEPEGPKEPAPKPEPEGPKEPAPKPEPEGPKEPAPDEGPPEEGPILGGMREPGAEKSAGLHLPPEGEGGPETEPEPEPVEEEPIPPHRPSDGLSPADHATIGTHGGGEEAEEEEEGIAPPDFPEGFPERGRTESAESYNNKLRDWIKRAFAHFKATGKLDKKGRIKFSTKSSDKAAGNMMSSEDLFQLLKAKGARPGPEEGPEESPPDEGPPPGPEEPPPGGVEGDLLKDTEAVREVLHRLRGIPHERQSPEDQKILRAVWQPWYSLRGEKKRYFNRRGNNGRTMRSNNPGKLPVVLPKVLRLDDPRVGILQKFYPDVFKALMHKGKVESEGDTEDSVRDRIEGFYKGRADKPSSGGNLAGRIDALDDPTAVAELKKELAAGREQEVRDILDALEAGAEEKDLGPLQGHWPPTENESMIAHYRRLLREGGKPVVRSEFAKLPLSERYQYFKKLLASG